MTVPSSLMSIVVPVSSVIERMVATGEVIETFEEILESQQRANAFVQGVFVEDQDGWPGDC